MEIFSSNIFIKLEEQGKFLMVVFSLKAYISIYNITNKNSKLIISNPGFQESVAKLNEEYYLNATKTGEEEKEDV